MTIFTIVFWGLMFMLARNINAIFSKSRKIVPDIDPLEAPLENDRSGLSLSLKSCGKDSAFGKDSTFGDIV